MQVDQLTPVSEMSLSEFIESKWFKGLARGAMIFCSLAVTIGGAVFGWAVFDTKSDVKRVTESVVALEDNIGTVKLALDNRIRDQESFQSAVDKDLGAIDGKVDTLDNNVDAVQQAMAEVKGILIQMQRQTDVANRSRLTGDFTR